MRRTPESKLQSEMLDFQSIKKYSRNYMELEVVGFQ